MRSYCYGLYCWDDSKLSDTQNNWVLVEVFPNQQAAKQNVNDPNYPYRAQIKYCLVFNSIGDFPKVQSCLENCIDLS